MYPPRSLRHPAPARSPPPYPASLKNIQAILAQQEMTLANVVKTTVFLADINDFAEMNKVYGEYFAQPYPRAARCRWASCPRTLRWRSSALL